jgi:hypothetical protein
MRGVLACVMLAAGISADAATPLKYSEETVINFGFATQLGSGIYSVAGRTLQVYRLPFAYALPAGEDARSRFRVTLPLTFGFLDFRPRDVVDNGLPERIDSLSFVPGLAWDFALREHWMLESFVEAGVARDRSSEIDQRVYAIGLRSRYDVDRAGTGWQLYNELLHSVVDQRATGDRDDFTRFRIGMTARRPFQLAADGRRPDWLAYGLVEIFTDRPVGPAEGSRGDENLTQFEVGLTLGATEPVRLWGISLPRVGLGYRFGEGLSVYRIVFGSPY